MAIITEKATMDEVTASEYRDMFDEIREGRSLRGLTQLIAFKIQESGNVHMLDGLVSYAMWDKYLKDPSALTRRMKNELRVANGIAPLPPTVEEAIRVVESDAVVILLDGTVGEVDQLVMGNRSDRRWQRLMDEPPVSRPRRVRAKTKRPSASLEQDARRQGLGVAWGDVIEAGLAALALGRGEKVAPGEGQEK